MAKSIFENALVVEVVQFEKGGYKNTSLRLVELGKGRPQVVEVNIEADQFEKYRALERQLVAEVVAESFNKSGVSAKGKAYAFTEYKLVSVSLPRKAA